MNSGNVFPATRTAALRPLSRAPWHSGHSPLTIKVVSRARNPSLSVWRKLSSKSAITPANGIAFASRIRRSLKANSRGPDPCKIASRVFGGRSFHGVSASKGNCSASCFSSALCLMMRFFPPIRHGLSAPQRTDFSGSATISSGTNRSLRPSPLQVPHAPSVALNEKHRGVSFSKISPHTSHASDWLSATSRHGASAVFCASTVTRSLPSRNASSSESASRLRWSAVATRRSITSSTFSSFVPAPFGTSFGSSRFLISPSSRTR